VNLENIMLNEISLTQKDKYSVYSDSTYMRYLEEANLQTGSRTEIAKGWGEWENGIIV